MCAFWYTCASNRLVHNRVCVCVWLGGERCRNDAGETVEGVDPQVRQWKESHSVGQGCARRPWWEGSPRTKGGTSQRVSSTPVQLWSGSAKSPYNAAEQDIARWWDHRPRSPLVLDQGVGDMQHGTPKYATQKNGKNVKKCKKEKHKEMQAVCEFLSELPGAVNFSTEETHPKQ